MKGLTILGFTVTRLVTYCISYRSQQEFNSKGLRLAAGTPVLFHVLGLQMCQLLFLDCFV